MKRRAPARCIAILSMALLIGGLAPGFSHAWDPATHAYIEKNLHKRQGLTDEAVLDNRIYGSFMIDIFNNNFAVPYVDFSAYLHDVNQDNFLKPWEIADSPDQKAFAYGFVGHNNTWGMDSTAHTSGITYGRGEGYVIAKARVLAEMLRPSLEASGLFLPDDALLDVCHYLVESGVDFLVRGVDPSIGDSLVAAAYHRSDEVPELLVEAYADDLAVIADGQGDTEQMILESETRSREYLMGYGWALTQDNALELVSAGLARQGAGYFALRGYPPIPEELLAQVAQEGIMAAMSLCAADFEAEVRATTGYVNGKLSAAAIVW